MPTLVTKIDTTNVEIDTTGYERTGLQVTFNVGAETVSVNDGVTPVLADVLYSAIEADGGAPFATFADMQEYFLLYVAPLISVEAMTVFQVNIKGVAYTRKDLTISENAEKLTVSDAGAGTLIDDEPPGRIYIAGETEPFADWATLWAWVQENMQDNVVLILAQMFNQVSINEVDYLRSALTVAFDDSAETVSITGAADYPDTLYSNVVNADGGEPFTEYAAMKTFVQENVTFLGQTITKKDDKGFYLVNGKPMGKGSMFFAWNDTAETLEIRYSHLDLSDKPMPATRYDAIVADNDTRAFENYQALIDYIGENTFVHPTPAP